jgi:hypothetical protein
MEIIRRDKSSVFGFVSKNFYAEFLSALVGSRKLDDDPSNTTQRHTSKVGSGNDDDCTRSVFSINWKKFSLGFLGRSASDKSTEENS